MAKRKRLTLSGETDGEAAGSPDASPDASGAPALRAPETRAPETKGLYPFGVAPAPISRITGEASATAALQDLASEVARARAEGRLLQALPLAEVDEGWLVRDRLAVDTEALSGLAESLRVNGQRAAIEVVDRGSGTLPRYGLISGWRRLAALRALHAETADARFATILAVLRRPETAGDAYVAMVEENEIRAGLSYYERARIAAMAVEAGVFPTPKAALQRLYAHASRSRRSKIGSFLTLHAALGSVLRSPAAIPERLGLALAMRIEADPDFAADVARRLAITPPNDAGAELALLARALKGEQRTMPASQPAPDIDLTFATGEIRLTGAGVDAGFRDRLQAWLRCPG